MNIDSSDLAKNYHLTYDDLKQNQVQTIPFIKAKEWGYYNTTGKLWKTIYYKHIQIPIITRKVLMDPENNFSTRLEILLKKRMDEWTEDDIKGNKN